MSEDTIQYEPDFALQCYHREQAELAGFLPHEADQYAELMAADAMQGDDDYTGD